MKPEQSSTIYRDSSPNTRTVDMQVAQDPIALGALQDNMSDLYKDRYAACARELMTNGNDASRAAGHTLPVDVELNGNTLTVTDHGIGMTADDIVNLYATYGGTTKRDSDEYQGMMGLGAKAPLALVDEFIVTTVRNGGGTTAIIRRNPDGLNQVTFVHEDVPTEAPTGTLITVEAPRGVDMHSAIVDVLRYWREEDGYCYTYHLDGEAVEVSPLDPTDDPDVWHAPRQQGGIVQGGVFYPHRLDHVFFVPIGSVDFTPSREELKMTERTEDTLSRIEEWYLYRPKHEPLPTSAYAPEGAVWLTHDGDRSERPYTLWQENNPNTIVTDVPIKSVSRRHAGWFPGGGTQLWLAARAWRQEDWARKRWPHATVITYAELKEQNKGTGTGTRSTRSAIQYSGYDLAYLKEQGNRVILGHYYMPESAAKGKIIVRLDQRQTLAAFRKRLPDAIVWQDHLDQYAQVQRYLHVSRKLNTSPLYVSSAVSLALDLHPEMRWRVGAHLRPLEITASTYRHDPELDRWVKARYPELEWLKERTPVEVIRKFIKAINNKEQA